jgi:para-nitrobenzyl esterase
MPASPQRHQIPTPVYKQSEDCLYMNIWTPAKTGTDNLPVMVWMMGGGFTSSSARTLAVDGARLAAKGVLVVNFNNRVGVLGWLAHPALSAESKDHVSGNYGLMDIIAALRWVQANVAAFGGDPQRITIFGQSSGSMTTSIMTITPWRGGCSKGRLGNPALHSAAISIRDSTPSPTPNRAETP